MACRERVNSDIERKEEMVLLHFTKLKKASVQSIKNLIYKSVIRVIKVYYNIPFEAEQMLGETNFNEEMNKRKESSQLKFTLCSYY